jgi:hypothetical protein
VDSCHTQREARSSRSKQNGYSIKLTSRDVKLTPKEAGEVEELLARSREERSIEQQIKQADGTGSAPRVTLAGGGGASPYATPGERFVQSAGYKAIADPSARSQQWSSGPVDVGPLGKGTLTSTTAGGPGGGLVPPHLRARWR